MKIHNAQKMLKFILISFLFTQTLANTEWYFVPDTNMFIGVECGNPSNYSSDVYLTPQGCSLYCRTYPNCTHTQYRYSQCRLYEYCDKINGTSSIVYELLPTHSPTASPTSWSNSLEPSFVMLCMLYLVHHQHI